MGKSLLALDPRYIKKTEYFEELLSLSALQQYVNNCEALEQLDNLLINCQLKYSLADKPAARVINLSYNCETAFVLPNHNSWVNL